MIFAHSPQAKGRIERAFGTLQKRLVWEMRLKGIHYRRGQQVPTQLPRKTQQTIRCGTRKPFQCTSPIESKPVFKVHTL